jgi:hypothetical protein
MCGVQIIKRFVSPVFLPVTVYPLTQHTLVVSADVVWIQLLCASAIQVLLQA